VVEKERGENTTSSLGSFGLDPKCPHT